MKNSTQDTPQKMDFYEHYTSFTDEQILEILKNHKDYRETAVVAAVKIAIERQLIHSEQDLLAPEFQNSRSAGFTAFPEIANDYHRQKLIGSLFRFMLVISFIPIIYGFLKYGEGQIDQTYLGVGVGITWLLLSLLLKKTKKIGFLITMFVLLCIVSLSVCLKIFSLENFRVLDLVMLIIGTLLPAYLMFYLMKLIRHKPGNNK